MTILELIFIAVALAMDAFAVSISKGLSVQRVQLSHIMSAGIWFGAFQAIMPLIGYFLGSTFASVVAHIDHWIAFSLLSIIGYNMIREACSNSCEKVEADFSFKTMLLMAIATSIDALAIGITFALLPDVNIFAAVSFIGVITFLFSAVGVRLGSIVGCKYKSKAEFAGGAILIILGAKILLEHLGVL